MLSKPDTVTMLLQVTTISVTAAADTSSKVTGLTILLRFVSGTNKGQWEPENISGTAAVVTTE